MSRTPTTTAILASLACLLVGPIQSPAYATQVAGYGRDGSRVYPDVTPPTTWTEEDVLWEAPLPSWNTGSPIVVGGPSSSRAASARNSAAAGKLFAMCEPAPGFYFALLVCLDAETGEELWRREVDHLAATGLPEAEQEEIRDAWQRWLENLWERNRLCARYMEDGDDSAKQEAEQKGYVVRDRSQARGRMRMFFHGPETEKVFKGLRGIFAKAGLCGNVSNMHFGCGLNAVGLAYGTPCSDGETIYVATAFGSVAAYDLDGNERWMGWALGSPKAEGCHFD